MARLVPLALAFALVSGCGDDSGAPIDGSMPTSDAAPGLDVGPHVPDGCVPGLEDCDGADDDCDGFADEGLVLVTYHPDEDGDGFGAEAVRMDLCAPPSGWIVDGRDCDDAAPEIGPDATEDHIDEVDEDCDGSLYYTGSVVADSTGCDIVTTQTSMDPEFPAVRVVGVYEAPTAGGEVLVRVELEQPVALVLVSATAVTWRVEETTPGAVRHILTDAAPSAVTAPATATIAEDTSLNYAYDFDARVARMLEDRVETALRPLASFHGCYRTGDVTLRPGTDWTGLLPPPPDCGAPDAFTAPDTTVLGAPCAAAMGESHWCLVSGSTTHVVGLDTGATCMVLDSGVAASGSAPNLAWLGRWLYSCDGPDGQLRRVSLVDGTIERSFEYCDGAIGDGNTLIVLPRASSGARRATSWTDVRCADFETLPGSYSDSRFGAQGGVLFTSWHSTGSVNVWNVATGAMLRTVPISGYSGWVDGLDATSDGMMIVTARGGSIRIHDAITGALQTSITAASSYGLECFPR